MILLVDIGNSRIKWAIYSPNQPITRQQAVSYQVDKLAEILTTEWGNLPAPQQVLIANVAGSEVAAACEAWLIRYWSIAGQFITSAPQRLGVHSAYAHPEKLGVDRWLSLLAAHQVCSNAMSAVVIDCGTSITIDVINSQGQHLGGLIAPGLALMRQALAQSTAGCPQINAATTNPDLSLGRNTEACIMQGTLSMAVAFIEQAVNQAHALIQGKLKCLISGGDAERLLPYLSRQYEFYPHLMLQGLALLSHEEN